MKQHLTLIAIMIVGISISSFVTYELVKEKPVTPKTNLTVTLHAEEWQAVVGSLAAHADSARVLKDSTKRSKHVDTLLGNLQFIASKIKK